MDKEAKVKLLQLQREKAIRLARENFYAFCVAINPSFFTPNRPHLKIVCDAFQGIYEGTIINERTGKPYRNMALSVPPSHGKSYTASLFSMWCFGVERKNRIITISYNETMSTRFAMTVRDGIMAEKGGMFDIVFQDVFPETRVKKGDASKQIWALEGNYQSYLASSFKASLTGMRGEIGIIDDPIKDHTEAFNEVVLEEKWNWYTDTFLSRLVEGGKQIVIATRWATKDLIGRLLEHSPDEWYEVRLPACVNEETGEMLAPDILSFDTFQRNRKLTSPEIFLANYQQEPMDAKGRLYTDLRTYEYKEIPEKFEKIFAYVDTADMGKDWLVAIVGGLFEGQIYVLDVLYTKDGMEKTEPQTAKLLYDNQVNIAKIESNSGGRGFARNVERLLWENHKSRYTRITWFHQSKNKMARILTHSTYVMDNVFFPKDWSTRWKDFYTDIIKFQREGKNIHDDCADGLTGLVEMSSKLNEFKAVQPLY